MKKPGLLFIIILVCSAWRLHAQEDFCPAVSRLVKSAAGRFAGIPGDYQIGQFNPGKKTARYEPGDRWLSTMTFLTRDAAFGMYDEIESLMAGCAVDSAKFLYRAKDPMELGAWGSYRYGRWKLPAGHPCYAVYVDVEIYPLAGWYVLDFSVNDGSTLMKLAGPDAYPSPAGRTGTAAGTSIGLLAPAAAGSGQAPCDGLARIIAEAAKDFSGICGAPVRISGQIVAFESRLRIDAAAQTLIIKEGNVRSTFSSVNGYGANESAARATLAALRDSFNSCGYGEGRLNAVAPGDTRYDWVLLHQKDARGHSCQYIISAMQSKLADGNYIFVLTVVKDNSAAYVYNQRSPPPAYWLAPVMPARK